MKQRRYGRERWAAWIEQQQRSGLMKSLRGKQIHRVVVGTYESMGHSEVELWNRDLLVAYDAVSALSERAQPALCGPDLRGRLIGFVDRSRTLPLLLNDRLLATFGFRHLDVPRHGFASTDVRIRWVRFSGQFIDNKDIIAIKRRGIWCNDHRNRVVGRESKSLVRSGRRVLVLTDSLQHIEHLSKYLPDWPVRVATDAEGHVLGSFPRLLAQRQTWVTGQCLLASTAALNAIRSDVFDCIVWAGSGPAMVSLPPRFLANSIEQPRNLTLVDFDDKHNKVLGHWSRQRMREYENFEWLDVSDPPDRFDLRCRQFLLRKIREAAK